jgi:MOSC domain-containing protein YiiM
VSGGRLLGIARKAVRAGAVELLESAAVTLAGGVEGDRIGKISKGRQVTVLRAEDWAAACAEIGADLPWTARRANLLIEGLELPFTQARLLIGDLVLSITGETEPCSRMYTPHIGLPDALLRGRGGRTCRVLSPGKIRVGDLVSLES